MHSWPYRFAVLTAVATLPLIFVGGLVTSHDAALAVPDWPTTYGYNMFLFPWKRMVGGIFYEHSHRLVASLVGLLTIILTVWLAIAEERSWLKWLGFVALALVIVQGVLGGLRVIWLKKEIAIFHAGLAQIFFCVMVAIALFTSNWWKRQPSFPMLREDGFLKKWTLLTTILIFFQLLLGATMRHTDSGLAVPDFPRIYGHWVPPLDSVSLAAINEARVWQWDLEPVAFWQIGLHLAHRVGAIVVSMGVVIAFGAAWRHHRYSAPLFYPALILVGLVLLQIGLGILVIWTRKAADIATAHVAVGALALATSFLFTLTAFRLLGPRRAVKIANKGAPAFGIAEGEHSPVRSPSASA